MARKIAPPAEGKMPGWELRPPDWLEAKLDEIKLPAFERGFRQKPHSSQDLFFPNFKAGRVYFYGEDWRRISDPESPEYDSSNPAYVDPRWPRYTGVDRSSKKRRGSAIFTIAVSPWGIRHVVDIRLGAWEVGTFLREIEEVYTAHRSRIIFVENNALQQDLIDMLSMPELGFTCQHVVEGFHTGKQKTDLEIGLPSLDVQFQELRWRVSIPHGRYEIKQYDSSDGSRCFCEYCTFVHDASTFTWEDLDTTPDLIMGAWLSKEASRMGEGFSLNSISVERIRPQQVKELPYTPGFSAVVQKLKLPVGVTVFDGQRFGSQPRGSFDGGRFSSEAEYYAAVQREKLARQQDGSTT